MDKNKQDLLLKITQQEDNLKRYKARLQDVVAAYKRVTAEKESIEKSLKAAVQTNKNISFEINSKQTDENSQDDIFSLKSRINTLAQSLSDLTIEKSRTESEFQADRKRLILENKQKEDIINDLKKQLEKQGNIHDTAVPYLHESRNTDVSRTELNDETNQTNVDELRDQLTKKLEEIAVLKKSNSELLSQIQCLKAVYNTNEDSSDKSSVHVLNKLKEELRTIQEQHNRAIQQEQRRVAEVEERSRLLVITHENRVTKLEDQLTELSNLICDYDRSRQTDREAISKLKNRLLHLEMDNRNSACEDDRNEPTREELIQQLINLKRILLLQSNTPEQFQHLKDCLMNDLDYSDISSKNFHNNSGSDRNNYNNERIESLQHIIEELKVDIMKLITVNKHFESKYEQIKSILEKERKLWEEKLNTSEMEYRKKLLSVEEKLMEERDKNLDIINEKDKQIMMLQRASNYNHTIKEYVNDEQADEPEIVKEESKEKTDTVSLFHYIQDGAYKEAEISRLREANNELENKIHTMQKDIYFREEVYKKSITQLKDYICRLERSSIMKDETNVEYLKNVILNFLSTVDNDKRMHMLNAIFTVLHLTDKEISQVMKYQMK